MLVPTLADVTFHELAVLEPGAIDARELGHIELLSDRAELGDFLQRADEWADR